MVFMRNGVDLDEATCTYEGTEENYTADTYGWDLDGRPFSPVLRCDVHSMRALPEVYESSDTGPFGGRCEWFLDRAADGPARPR